MVRTPSCDKNGLKKGTWTAEEDRKLTAYVTRYGCWNWRQLPKFAGLSRCGKSCRLRWMNYLRPNIKRGNYSKEEEDTIIKLHESIGNRWSVIAAQLPGRTDNEIKNHWHTNLKKRVSQNSSVSNEEKHDTNNLAPREKRQKRLKQPNNSLANQITSQIIDSSPSSPQPSSSGSSSISKDSTAVATSTEAYEETSGNFWTEPFLTDCSFVSSDFPEQPFMNTEYLSPVFDEFFCPYGLYEEKLNLNNLSKIIDNSPSSPQLSSSELSSITRDTAAATSTNMAAEDNVTSSEAYAETSGDFWPQPFSADNSYIPNDFLEPFMEAEYLSPVFDEFMCLYGFDGEHEGFN